MSITPAARVRTGFALACAVTIGSLGAGISPAGAAPTAGAIEDLAFCTSNELDRGYDVSSSEISIPFAINHLGTVHDSLYVNTNGSVSFEEAVPGVDWSGWDFSGIAPFYSPVSTEQSGSSPVTFGTSPDGTAFCVNWVNVGVTNYDSTHSPPASESLTNSFQLVVRDRSGLADGVRGDVDVTFNYDELKASGVNDGPFPAWAGIKQTGGDGWAISLPGSGLHDNDEPRVSSLVDGASRALTAGSFNSLDTAGRYIFALRDGTLATGLGSITGIVSDSNGDPLPGAIVQGPTGVAVADSSGRYWLGNVFGEVLLRVNPPAGNGSLARFDSVTVLPGEEITHNVTLSSGPRPVPTGTTVTQDGHTVSNSMYSGDFALSHNGCAGGAATYTVYRAGSNIELGAGTLTETTPGTYAGTVPSLRTTGSITVTISVDCAGTVTQSSFDLYIDPSGTIVDTAGDPVPDATVTLLRADQPEGPFTVVPDGSAIMSPSNRTNPGVTAADGRFGWDVLTGYYLVQASASGCTVPGSTDTVAQTDVLPVPPEQLDLELVLDCGDETDAPDPAAPDLPIVTLSGSHVAQGGSLTVTGTHFAADETVTIWLHSAPQVLATVTASATGDFTQAVTIPTSTEVGAHTVILRGETSPSASAALTVTAAKDNGGPGAATPTGDGSALATTGAGDVPLAIFGGLALIAGLGLALRRPRTPRSA